jgi:hypothetical protein
MSVAEFSGQQFEFAVGSLQGLRAWDVDEFGRLHGVTHREVWRPGGNVSVCKQTVKTPCPRPSITRGSRPAEPEHGRKKKRRDTIDFEVRFTPSVPCGDPTCAGTYHYGPASHRFDPACQCGFWAYDEASFTPQGEIVGVIDAYGKTTIGTKGFRAERASILALSRRDRNDKPLSRSLTFRLASLYPEVQFFDSLDALIEAHDGVLRDWGEVDDGFWLKPVPEREDSLSGAWSRLYQSFTLPRSYSIGGVV